MSESKKFIHKKLYSARVENHTNRNITVEGTYWTSEFDEPKEEKMIIPMRPGDAKTFASKSSHDSRMHLVQFFVTDGEGVDTTIEGPFVSMDRDRETLIIDDTPSNGLTMNLKTS